jgi:NAD(P)-dependent dehydrogenase (short-subunit alcohol dehydrogenase family)
MAKHWSANDIPEQSGKTFVVTGSNSGIGLEAARALAQRGAEVILACRSQEKGQLALDQLRAETPAAKAKLMKLDLASLASIREFAERFKGEHGRLDALINNAGLMAIPRATTADGFEMQLGTNHLGHFALTGLLFGRLVESGTAGVPARVVSVASQAHRMGKMRFDDLMGEKRYEKWAAYGQSKLANLLFTFELARRIEARWGEGATVAAIACHPGYSATELQGKGPELEKSAFGAMIMKLGNGLLAQSAAMGALPTLRAACDPDAKSGDYYGPAGITEMAGPPVKVGCTTAAKDPESARQLWERSRDLTGVDFP